jgi:tight adherence protein B
MKRRVVAVLAAFAALAACVSAAASTGRPIELTPIGRLPFPERGYIVDLPPGAAVAPNHVRIRENGRLVRDVDIAPLDEAAIHFGVVLALDASESMTGAPLQSAVGAARSFVAHRVNGQEVGIVAFNGGVQVLRPLTSNASELEQTLSGLPDVAYGTRIYDAIDRSLTLLARGRLSSGSIVLLSDGADLGSTSSIDKVVARARSRHVRIFTVGLRSGAFESQSLQRLAEATGGRYAEAASPKALAGVYAALGERLASEYVVRYRSDAPPRSHVNVSIEIGGVGAWLAKYTAPTPAGLAPFHRSLAVRFFLSPAAPLLVSLLIALLVALAIVVLVRPAKDTLIERVAEFTGRAGRAFATSPDPVILELEPRRPSQKSGILTKLERDLEIARVEMPASRVALITAVATLVVVFICFLIAPVFAVVGLATPLITRSIVAHKLRKVREEFADQLPPNLQVLASALRAGHSFIGSLSVVVDNAHEPSRSELQRVVMDERLGVPVEDALRRVAMRMESRDLDQLALLAELQRTAGGNAAEVIDTVVETLRERLDLRRLVRTLTAQGRLARWVLSALPAGAAAVLLLLQPTAVLPLFQTGIGQVALVFAAALVIAGSLVIQKLVTIKV